MISRKATLLQVLLTLASAAPSFAHAAGSRWSVLHTPNFRIMHLGSPVADQIAQQLEQARSTSTLWLAGELPERSWSPRCDVYVYPSREDLHLMTGRRRWSIGSSLSRPSRLSHGQILSRRINLAADDGDLLSSTLPHEVTHVVLKELFGGKPVPLWANEGLAVLSEGAPKNQRYTAYVWRKVRGRGHFALRDLMAARSYPEDPYKHLFYGQSVSLVRFFLSLGTPQQLISFLQLSAQNGLEQQLLASYGIAGLEELQQQWTIFAEVLGKWVVEHR